MNSSPTILKASGNNGWQTAYPYHARVDGKQATGVRFYMENIFNMEKMSLVVIFAWKTLATMATLLAVINELKCLNFFLSV